MLSVSARGGAGARARAVQPRAALPPRGGRGTLGDGSEAPDGPRGGARPRARGATLPTAS